MNELINKGICRTAPATPGLLKIHLTRVTVGGEGGRPRWKVVTLSSVFFKPIP